MDGLKRVSPRLLVGHADRVLVAGDHEVVLLDPHGTVVVNRHFGRRQVPQVGGFSSDGSAFIEVHQRRAYEPPALNLLGVDSGEAIGSADVAAIHELIRRALGTPSPAKNYTDSAQRTLAGGWWFGRVTVTSHPDDRTLTLGVIIPTGEIVNVLGEKAALIERHYIRIAVSA